MTAADLDLSPRRLKALAAFRDRSPVRGPLASTIPWLKAERLIYWVGPGSRDWALTDKGVKALAASDL